MYWEQLEILNPEEKRNPIALTVYDLDLASGSAFSQHQETSDCIPNETRDFHPISVRG